MRQKTTNGQAENCIILFSNFILPYNYTSCYSLLVLVVALLLVHVVALVLVLVVALLLVPVVALIIIPTLPDHVLPQLNFNANARNGLPRVTLQTSELVPPANIPSFQRIFGHAPNAQNRNPGIVGDILAGPRVELPDALVGTAGGTKSLIIMSPPLADKPH